MVVHSDAFAIDAPKEAIYTEMAIHPQAIYSNGRTFVAYQGPGLSPYVTAYDHATKMSYPRVVATPRDSLSL